MQYSTGVAHTCAFSFPTTLKKLTLSNFNCPWSKISGIGKLPNLEILKLHNSTIEEERWDVGEEKFLKLKCLKLSILKISHWEASTSSFPCLERLVVRNCCFLVELPSIFEDIPSLKMIEVRRCPKVLSTLVKSILNAQQDMGNEDLEVLISDELDEDRCFSSSVLATPNASAHIDQDTGIEDLELLTLDVLDEHRSFSASVFSASVPHSPIMFNTCSHLRTLTTWHRSRKFSNFSYRHIYGTVLHYIGGLLDKKVAYETPDVQKPLGLDKKGVIERSVAVACVRKRHVPSAKRTILMLKHNCQPRQVIMFRHSKMELKRDQ